MNLRAFEHHEFKLKTMMVMRGHAGAGGLRKQDHEAIEQAKSGSMRKLAASLIMRTPRRDQGHHSPRPPSAPQSPKLVDIPNSADPCADRDVDNDSPVVQELVDMLPPTLSSLSDMEQTLLLLEKSDNGIRSNRSSPSARLFRPSSAVLTPRNIQIDEKEGGPDGTTPTPKVRQVAPGASPLDRRVNPYTARRSKRFFTAEKKKSPRPPAAARPAASNETGAVVSLAVAPSISYLKTGLRSAWNREIQESAIARGSLVKEFANADHMRREEKRMAKTGSMDKASDDDVQEWQTNAGGSPAPLVENHPHNVLSTMAMFDARTNVFQMQEAIMTNCRGLMRSAISSDTKMRETLMQHFVDVREAYNVVLVRRKQREEMLLNLRLSRDAEIAEYRDYELMTTKALQRKEELTSKLQTMVLKNTEMEENRENEKQKLTIMKIEMYEQLNLIGALNRETEESALIYARMEALRRAANVRREAAEWTIDGLRRDLRAMQGNLAIQLSHLVGVKEQIKGAQVTMMKGHARRVELKTEFKRKISRDVGVSKAKDAFFGLLEKKRYRQREQWLHTAETQFRELAAQVGVDPMANFGGFMHKYDQRDDVANDLRVSIANIQQRMARMNVERDAAERELEQLLHGRRTNTWNAIDDTRTRLVILRKRNRNKLEAHAMLLKCLVSLEYNNTRCVRKLKRSISYGHDVLSDKRRIVLRRYLWNERPEMRTMVPMNDSLALFEELCVLTLQMYEVVGEIDLDWDKGGETA
eukprot:SAG31_NODE_2717_length_5194_cov_2.227085_2_plen_756_part_00